MSRRLFVILLVALVCLANVARGGYRARTAGPRFAAEGAAHLRYTNLVAHGAPIPAVDAMAQWPEGLRVHRETSPAMEYVYGFLYRLIPGTKPGIIPFIRVVSALFYSLALVPLALLSAALWRSRAAGLVTAGVAAVAIAVVARSSGFEYIRENFALPLIAFHAWLFVSSATGGGARRAVASGCFLFAALASWQGSQFYLAPFAGYLLLRRFTAAPGPDERRAARIVIACVAAAGIAVPFLREGGFLLSLPIALAAAWLAADLVGAGRPRALAAAAGASAGGAVVAIGAAAGRHAATYSHFLGTILYKLRYIEKPADPQLLPFDVRAFWLGPMNGPDAFHFFVFALPILLLMPAPVSRLIRRAREGEPEAVFVGAFLAVSFFLFLLMQRLLPLFGLFAAVAAGGVVLERMSGARLRGLARAPIILLAFVAVLSLFQDFGWEGRADLWKRLARIMRIPQRTSFIIYPIERDPEGALLGWIRENTERDAVVMSLHYLSPAVLTYTGRPTNLNDFFESPRLRAKAAKLLSLLYGGEENLYRFCVEQQSRYLLVSCAVGCDPTLDSPIYQAGLTSMPPGCAAYRLAFEPERLERFELVYENEAYRLFRVGRTREERIWMRSPLFYDRDLLWRHNGNILDFYNTIMRIYALNRQGRLFLAEGSAAAAERSFVESLREHYFFPAWRSLDALYASQRRASERLSLAEFAHRSDPNRPAVCLALASARLDSGETEGVREILERCLAMPGTSREKKEARDLLDRLGSPAEGEAPR